MKQITIDKFLTEEQIKQAIKLKKAKSICDQIIKPNIKHINELLGQENDPRYLAYVVEYVINSDCAFCK